MVYIESISPATANDVLLYVPNLIGYLRVLCTVASLFLMMSYPHLWFTASVLYILSFVGDLFGTSKRLCHTGTVYVFFDGSLISLTTNRTIYSRCG